MKTYKNKLTGEIRELTDAQYTHLLPVYDRKSNSLVEKAGFVLAPKKPKGGKAKEILDDVTS